MACRVTSAAYSRALSATASRVAGAAPVAPVLFCRGHNTRIHSAAFASGWHKIALDAKLMRMLVMPREDSSKEAHLRDRLHVTARCSVAAPLVTRILPPNTVAACCDAQLFAQVGFPV